MENNKYDMLNEDNTNESTEQTKVKEETPKEEKIEKPNTGDLGERHTKEDPYTKTSKLDIKGILEDKTGEKYDGIVYPTGDHEDYLKFYKVLNNMREKEAISLRSILTEEQQYIVTNNLESFKKTPNRNIYSERLNTDPQNFVNNLEFGESPLNPRPLNFNTKGKISNESAIARFYAFLGTGEVVQVPLWHSGFWVTLRPIKQKDFINLTIALNNNAIDLGRSTSALIYSNYSVVFIRIVTDFIIDNIVDTTIKLKPEDDIRTYIKTQDLYPLINGIISAMHPKGVKIYKACHNTFKLDQDNKPVCDFFAEATVDTKKLLWVDKKALTSKHLSHMSHKQPRSVSTSEVLEYQQSLEILKPKEVKIVVDKEKEKWIKFTFSSPNLLDYVTIGEQWVNDLIKETENLFTKEDSQETKAAIIEDMVGAVKSNVYNSYIKAMEFSDGNKYTTPEEITQLLDVLSSDLDTHKELIKEISTYLNDCVIAIIATPNFICPKCKANQTAIKKEDKEDDEETKSDDKFKEFIPLNLLENFFDLRGLMLRKIRS